MAKMQTQFLLKGNVNLSYFIKFMTLFANLSAYFGVTPYKVCAPVAIEPSKYNDRFAYPPMFGARNS